MHTKTIAAISTPQGTGGIGVVRISGREAVLIADKVFKSKSGKKLLDIPGYTALFGDVYSGETPLDECVALVFKAPKSYTGEDVVELSVHGGNYILKAVLRAVLDAGAKEAGPGEFTYRAFTSGKMDLLEAESVMELISASGENAHRSALATLGGEISKKIAKIREGLLTASAGLAVFTDYPDDELPEFSEETLFSALNASRELLEEMLANFDQGKLLREGIDTVIAGRPNVGKSTLMNLLCGTRRSIVTSLAGTTRDVVEETVILGDIKLKLSDTAGLRETGDIVEQIGVDISREKILSAGLILAVFDGSEEADGEDKKLIEECRNRPAVIIINKNDLERKFDLSLVEGLKTIEISAEDASSVKALERAVLEVCNLNSLDGSETFLCSERQREAAKVAHTKILEAIELMQNKMTLDAVGIVIDEATESLLSLTGERVTEEVVKEVFSKFCVGK